MQPTTDAANIRGLAIELSGRRGEVALALAGKVVAEAELEHGLRHAAGLVPLVDRLCRDAGWPPASIKHVYVSAGPGGFTGTRIGVTFAKTLALGAGAQVVAVPSPRVLVENLPPDARHGLVVLDARRGKVWAERFDRDAAGHWQSTRPGGWPGLAVLADVLADAPRPLFVAGEGVAYHRQAMDESQDLVVMPDAASDPRAAIVVRLGWAMAQRGDFANAFALTPVYVRRPEAEEKRLEREAETKAR